MKQSVHTVSDRQTTGVPLAPWTYRNAELFDLEYEAFFLRRWQCAGHVSELAEPGAYLTLDLGRDNLAVVRGRDGELRAFVNVCRHRASRLLEGRGLCRGAIRCRYHGWTYTLDGRLKGIPSESDFPGLEKRDFGLREVELEVFYGLVFVRVVGGGPSVAESFGEIGSYFQAHGVSDYEPIFRETSEVWHVNWKVAWDNYLENYHIPVGHPGLQRLLVEAQEAIELSSGVSMGIFDMRDVASEVPEEAAYQRELHHTNYRLPEALHGKWVQIGFTPNLGLDLYPEMLDLFQLTPQGLHETRVTMRYFGHRSPTPKDRLLRRLNIQINEPVNEEDRLLCERVQSGLRTTAYQPGPLSLQESSVHYFHELVRAEIPVAALSEAPSPGSVAEENGRFVAEVLPKP